MPTKRNSLFDILAILIAAPRGSCDDSSSSLPCRSFDFSSPPQFIQAYGVTTVSLSLHDKRCFRHSSCLKHLGREQIPEWKYIFFVKSCMYKGELISFSLNRSILSHISISILIHITMRSILAFTSLLALASAAATPQRKADYAKHKVIRVKHTPEIDQWINEFSLPTWIKQGGNIDVVVPPSVSVLNGVKSTVMHADLGESIKQESKFQAYAGKWFFSKSTRLFLLI